MRCKRAGDIGLSIPEAKPDLPRLMAYKQSVVEQLVGGVEQLLKARRITVVRGTARMTGSNTLSVEDAEGGRQEISATQVIVATGSIPAEAADSPAATFLA